MNLGKFFKTIAAGAALLTSAFTGATQPPARTAHGPALWKIADADTTIYLFGTIHTLPADAAWRTPPVAQALAQADTLVLELVLDDPAKSAQLLGSMGMSPGLPPLGARVPPGKREALRKLVATSGYPPPFLDQLESWAAAIVLTNVAFTQAGFSPDQGVERKLTEYYEQANKPVIGLETTQQQLGFLDSLPETAQRSLLAGSIEDPKAVRVQLRAMLAAWLRGDVQAIAATFDKETKASPALRQALLLSRNQAWSKWIAARLGQPGIVFLAVGAGHLAGRDSLQQMLKARGIRAERVN